MNRNSTPPTKIELVLATGNIHKIREFKTMLKDHPSLDLRTLRDFPLYTPPEETGKTFDENAILKATHAAKELNRWVLADDSGLVVPSLGGAPGVYSSRFAGNDATSADNRKKLLEMMQHILEDDRSAYYECCLALASPTGLKKTVRGTCEGAIANAEKGGGGFGYDSLFIKHGYNKTFAELEESLKNRVSHRRKALDKILSSIETLFSSVS